MTNPAFVNWVLMVKDGEEKMVHPGNVGNHERFGWKRKHPEPAQDPAEARGAGAPVDDKAYQSLTLPELTEAIVKHEADEAAVSTETDVPPADETPAEDGLEVLVKPEKPRRSRKTKK